MSVSVPGFLIFFPEVKIVDFSVITDIINMFIGIFNYIVIAIKKEEAQTIATLPRKA